MKLKRLFTAVLSTALALSLCAMPAMATEGGTTAGTPLADGMPVWDTTQKGSITIHKFEYNLHREQRPNRVPVPRAKPRPQAQSRWAG